MSHYAEKVLKLVSEPDYKPITLKAMSRRFEVDPDDYAEFRAVVKELVKEGKLDLGKDKTLRKPSTQGTIVGIFRRSPKGFGFVRPHSSNGQGRPDLHLSRGQPATPPAATRSSSRSPSDPKTPGMNVEGRIVQIARPGLGALRRDLLRGWRRRLRPDRRHDVPRPDLRRRPRRQGGQAGRQGRHRDGPLPDALPRGRGGHHRDPRPARTARGRHALDHPRLQHPRHLRRRRARRGPRAGHATSTRTEIGERLDLRDVADRHDRPGHRPRLRRRDLPVARRARLLEPGGPHRRRLALRPRRLGAGPTRRGSGARASTCPTASSRCSRRSSPTAWRASRRAASATPSACCMEFNAEGIRTVAAVRPLGDPRRPSLHLRAGAGRHEGPGRRSCRRRARGRRGCSARCSSWP